MRAHVRCAAAAAHRPCRLVLGLVVDCHVQAALLVHRVALSLALCTSTPRRPHMPSVNVGTRSRRVPRPNLFSIRPAFPLKALVAQGSVACARPHGSEGRQRCRPRTWVCRVLPQTPDPALRRAPDPRPSPSPGSRPSPSPGSRPQTRPFAPGPSSRPRTRPFAEL